LHCTLVVHAVPILTVPKMHPYTSSRYQLTMCYALWRAGRTSEPAVFDLFFRKNPFKGQFTVFAGLSEALALLSEFSFTDSDVQYLRTALPHCEEEYFTWLRTLDCSAVRVYAIAEGSVVFPREPLLRIEGPLGVCQLLETPLLNLVNFPSLIATNAARFREAAGEDKTLLEFGLRRAQGPDVSTSIYH
jgi:nicotinate phosphoribosyltransferase